MCGIPFFASASQSPPLVGCPRAVRNGESARTSVVSTAYEWSVGGTGWRLPAGP